MCEKIVFLDRCIKRFISLTKKLRLFCRAVKEEIKKILALCLKKPRLGNAFVGITQTSGISSTFDKNSKKAVSKFKIFEIPFS